MRKILLFGMIFLAAAVASNALPQASVRSYRYSLSTYSQEGSYAVEVTPSITLSGTRYEVESDALGRRLRVAVFRGGKKLSETVYRFAADAKLPSEYETFRAGEKTGLVRIQRNAAGHRVRQEFLTVTGTLTRYTTISYPSSDRVEQTSYSAEGKKLSHTIYYYSPAGVLLRFTTYTNPEEPAAYTETEVEPATGLAKNAQQFSDGKPSVRRTYTYDANGDALRMDAYDAGGKWFAADEYADSLVTKRIYQLESGTKEIRYVFDEKRWLKESAVSFSGTLICRLVYDRFPNGSAKRTLALGPGGELWAEYFDREIRDIARDGEPVGGSNFVMHKKGNWW